MMNTMIKFALVALLAFIVVAEAGRKKSKKFKEHHCSECGNSTEEALQSYLKCHHKNYTSEGDRHFLKRLDRFLARCKKIQEWDPDAMGYAIGLDQTAWMTDEEYNQTLNHVIGKNWKQAEPSTDKQTQENERQARQALPASVDWVAGVNGKVLVTSVKDQGSCGSCYTFAAAAALEGQMLAFGYQSVDVSEQQYADCALDYSTYFWKSAGYWRNSTSCVYTYNYDIRDYVKTCTVTPNWIAPTSWTQYLKETASDQNGCHGGDPGSVYAYNILNVGQNSEACYPYVSGKTKISNACAPNPACSTNIKVKNVTQVVGLTAMMTAVANVGPLACALDAGILNGYAGGIINNPSYNPPNYGINHAVTAVGYGVDATTGTPFWLVKNSWGVTWGDKGYFRIYRGSNMAGFENSCVYPNL